MTVTRVPSLAHWGAFNALVEGGRVVGCEPFAEDPAPSPMLSAIPDLVHSPLRIARPVIREGWREGKPRTGHDRFREVSWDEALDAVAQELRRVRRDHGAESIFGGSYGWSSAGRLHHARSLVRRFLFLGGGCVDQVGNYSWGAAQFLLPHVIGTFQPVAGRVTDWPSIVKHTKLMIAFGGLALKNGQVSSGGMGAHVLEKWLTEAKRAGVRFVVISPLRSDAPDMLDAEWIPIRPNTDTALILALAHTLIIEDRHDKAFLDTHCVGFDRFRDYVLGNTDGVVKDAAWAERITGVSAATITQLARDAADVRSLLTLAWSLQRAHRGEQPYWAAIALASMLGGIGKPGGGFAFGHGSLNGVGVPRADLPGPEMPLPPNPARASIPVARIADMLLQPGARYEFNGKTSSYPDIRLIYWAGGNPFHHHQDLNRLRRGWQRPETIVVHESVWTPTARHADIVLPVTTTLERNDVGGSSRDPYVFAMRKAIAPVGEARSDYDIFSALAERLGYGAAFTDGRSEMDWCRAIYDTMRRGAEAKGVSLPDFDSFWSSGYVALPPPERDFVLFEDFRRDPAAHPLKTPSGKIEIASTTIEGFGYDDCPAHPAWLPPTEWLGDVASHQKSGALLHLVTHQPETRLHSQFDASRLSRSGKVHDRETIRLNPSDARARGIGDRDAVRVFNARGACFAAALLDEAVMPGVAVMPTGSWFDPARGDGPERHGNPNVLTLDTGTSRLTQGPSALTALVEVERWTAPLPKVEAFDPPTIMQAELQPA
jgi:biotin/methionine sulfoxide reductase